MKSSCAWAILGIFSIFACTQSTTAEPNKETNYENTAHNDIEITIDQANELCQKFNERKVKTNHIYLWVPVDSTPQPQPATQAPTFTPGCYTIKYIGCKGESQYPISEQCGFFTLVPKAECTSAGTGKGRSRRSPSAQQKISLSHGQVTQLCVSIENLPKDEPFQINFIPIRVDLTPKQIAGHLSESCVTWVHEPCADNKEQTEECGSWKFQVASDSKCHAFIKLYQVYNSSQIARFPNPMTSMTDFVMNAEETEQDVATGIDKLLSDKIQCTRDGSSITCKVTKKGDRSKRATAPQIPVTRVKRACCGLYRCGRCGRPRLFRQLEPCDCSNDPGGLCDASGGACDMYMEPYGCYGNCLF